MIGYKLFMDKLDRFSVEDSRCIIGNIMGIDVLLFSFDVFHDSIILKFYDGYTYYQFNFIFEGNENFIVPVKCVERLSIYDVFVNNLKEDSADNFCFDSNFYRFVKLLRDGDISYFEYFL